MSLRDIKLKLSYRTGRDDMVNDFLVPCLGESVSYRRAAGYFSSHGLALAARGVAKLVKYGGEMRLVVSPCLQPDDVDALQKAIDQPLSLLKAVSARCMADVEESLIKARLNALAWLAASGYLKIRLALPVDDRGLIKRGIYHEKVGILTDSDGAHVAFNGSANETAGGLLENFESIDVYRSWNDPDDRIGEKIANFEAMWANQTPGLRTIEFSEAGRELLEAYRDPDHPPDGLSTRILREDRRVEFRAPEGLALWDYQTEAIRAWSKNGGQGILAMATGTGKTLTALVLASKVAEKNKPMVLIVVCPFLNLCKQWMREMAAFGLRPLACYEGKDRWQPKFEEGYQRLGMGLSSVHAIVTTNKTFQSEAFQSYLRPHVSGGTRQHHLLIADEVHNLGAEKVQQFPPEIGLRLGLSATPDRHYDPIGIQTIVDYFGGVIFEYPIDRATIHPPDLRCNPVSVLLIAA